ncbi:prepilin peptidase [Clostridia bacterium]|nr:prepilin peptidase [Clostridia bacterium]
MIFSVIGSFVLTFVMVQAAYLFLNNMVLLEQQDESSLDDIEWEYSWKKFFNRLGTTLFKNDSWLFKDFNRLDRIVFYGMGCILCLAIFVNITDGSAWLHIMMVQILLFMSVIDAKTQEIPDAIHMGLLPLVMVYLLLYSQIGWKFTAVGGILAFVFFFVLFLFGAMGGGDVKLIGICGLYLGFPKILMGILAGMMFGSIVGLTLIALKKKTRKDRIAFGPYIALGIVVTQVYFWDIIFFLYY